MACYILCMHSLLLLDVDDPPRAHPGSSIGVSFTRSVLDHFRFGFFPVRYTLSNRISVSLRTANVVLSNFHLSTPRIL